MTTPKQIFEKKYNVTLLKDSLVSIDKITECFKECIQQKQPNENCGFVCNTILELLEELEQ